MFRCCYCCTRGTGEVIDTSLPDDGDEKKADKLVARARTNRDGARDTSPSRAETPEETALRVELVKGQFPRLHQTTLSPQNPSRPRLRQPEGRNPHMDLLTKLPHSDPLSDKHG